MELDARNAGLPDATGAKLAVTDDLGVGQMDFWAGDLPEPELPGEPLLEFERRQGELFLTIPVGKVLRGTGRFLRGARRLTSSTVQIPASFLPIVQLLANPMPTTQPELTRALDEVFDSLYRHPVTHQSRRLSAFLRDRQIIPNEQTTERLIRFLVDQAVARSPVPVPEAVVDEFWSFFHDLFSSPELKGLLEPGLDIARLVLRTYEPLLVELINLLKEARRVNQGLARELTNRLQVVRGDITIIRRQLQAIRYVKPFLATAPDDFAAQAQIVAAMVREFGPFFIKMAQVAAANSDFLPEEIARELAVFQEDVEPMTAREVEQAFLEAYGCSPKDMYVGFDLHKPIRSGSIGSVYLAKKPVVQGGIEVLRPVIVKIGRYNLEREFLMGKTAIGLTLLSSQYWAPHSKLAPFLEAMLEQVDEFVSGFEQELNFEDEARIQRRFHRRARKSRIWQVPEVFASNHRILEMEYLDDAKTISRALEELPTRGRRRYQRRMASRFLYTVLTHILVYKEFHGDLHPGNVMVNEGGKLFLIDWGNAVKLRGRWGSVWNYLLGVVAGDIDRLADTLVVMSNDPETNRLRRDEIADTLRATMEKRGIQPLGRNFPLQLQEEGIEGLHRRFQTAAQLMSNTQHLGLVIDSDYLHLSRSLFAMIGSYTALYDGMPRSLMAYDMTRTIARFPLDLAVDRAMSRGERVRRAVVRWLPTFRRSL